jgi:predicted DNA-binding transcriptional regulator YafY|tara:strand:+ start:1245 stop:2231 length:987 start_codon:yes stop_codon:yes gene_type:complete
MPINKNAYRRYKVIDLCLRNKMRTYPDMNDLLAAIEEKLDVNTTAETVQKDIAVMKMSPPDGFDAPIKFNRTHLGYEYTNPNFSIYGVSLNSYDVDSINEAIDVISSIGGSRVSDKFTHAIEKVLSNVQELSNTEEKRRIIQTDHISEGRGFEHFDLLYAACRDRVPISFVHYSYIRREFKALIVHPVLLKEFNNHWYVIGFSEAHQALRTFGFDRVKAPVPIYKVFQDTSPHIIDEYLNDVYGVYPLNDGKKEKIILHTNSMITNYFRAQNIHPSQKVEMRNKGDAIISFELIPSMEFVSLILSYGKQIRVVEPAHLAETVKKNSNG